MALAKMLWTFDTLLPEDRGKWVEWESVKSYAVLDMAPIKLNIRVRD